MFKILLFLCIGFLVSIQLHAQTTNDTIRVGYSFFGNEYFLNGKSIERADVNRLLSSKENTKELLYSSQNTRLLGTLVMGAGVLYGAVVINEMVQEEQYSDESDKDDKIIIKGGIAAGVTCVGILLFSSANTKFQKAIKLYNKQVTSTASELEINLGLIEDRLALTIDF